jgi:hypothetical protein
VSTLPMVEENPVPTSAQGFFSVYGAPRQYFARLRPRPLWTVLAFLLLNAAFAALWLHHMDPGAFARVQLEDAGVWAGLDQEQQDQILYVQAQNRVPLAATTILGPFVLMLVVASLFRLLLPWLLARPLGWSHSLAIVSATYVAVDLIRLPLILLTMWLGDSWNVHPQLALEASPALLIERRPEIEPLFVFLQSFDVFAAWTVFLLCVGYASALHAPVRRTAYVVVGAWLVFVAVKVISAILVGAGRLGI